MERVRVLLIEDDEDDYVLTRDFLRDVEGTNYVLDWVTNGTDALTRLRHTDAAYDACLIDYRLGGETGLDVLRKIAQANINVPMIFLTGNADPSIDMAVMYAGATDFLIKSEIDGKALDRSIRYVRAVERQAQERMRAAVARESQIQAEAANKSKDHFLAIVSHELRDPLNTLTVWIDVLKRPDIDPELQRTALETVERCAKQQAAILGDLIDLSRSVNGLIRIHKRKVVLGELLKDLIDGVLPEAAAKSLRVVLEPVPSNFQLLADPVRLRQVFSNILFNSIKFTAAHGEIAVRAELAQLEGRDAVRTVFLDNGVGISPDLLPKVLKAYLHADECKQPRAAGLGLGLTIAHHLVALHGGTIKVESAGVGTGTAVSVVLPLMGSDDLG